MVRWQLLWLAACLALTYDVQGQQAAVSGRGLLGEYYSGRHYEKKVFTRIDPTIDFGWFDQPPGPGMPASYFSVRWTGKLYAPASGKYTFTAEVDDGIRLWVGGKMVIDDWELNDSKTFTGSIILTAGQYYDLRIDYFNDMLEGEIKIYWTTPEDNRLTRLMSGKPGSLIPAKYLFQPKFAPPKPAVARTTDSAPPAKTTTPGPLPAKVAGRTSRPSLPAPKVQASQPPRKTDSVTVKPVAPPAVSETFEGLKAGEAVVLRNVFFEQSQYHLLPESYTELDKLVKTLKKYPVYQIEISGHTDNVGDPRLNLTLSEYRAKVVANYLSRHGIDANRLDAKGYGSTRPVTDNATEDQRARNRRVEFVVK
ncbi:PA14 domain-containing protein [Nibrella saemangeumensis]|uniref:PA14 domain-containing protein n=1 Tax=Nibrella saemangeumensis TaxID=1084526 RepID=A0ABP8N5N7_9BACT